ncbi:MAG TPA: 23S rRNA pseudouridine(1911/1915/1917) synthase RluD [Chromatiales bacterium]|nr:23S rRNA pseudouridine(1911/1915/1917) synthase RluD [Chromatiales bacterium]
MPEISEQTEIPESLAGKRLDQALAEMFPDYSRARLQSWVKQGQIRVNQKQWRCKDKVRGGEVVALNVEESIEQTEFEPEPVALDVLHEDESIIILNKPKGLVVHPASGNWSGTLLNGLLHRYPELGDLPRAGIVHRLDKNTTGVMVVARNLKSHKSLVDALQARSMGREYLALVQGALVAGGTIDAPIGRHPKDRKRMAVVNNGKEAVTHYLIAERFKDYTLLRVKLETGRTHQIRVHMSHTHHPIVGDPVYGGRLKLPREASEELMETLRGFRRQALHAETLTLIHPESGEPVSWSAPVPDDFQNLLTIMRTFNQ